VPVLYFIRHGQTDWNAEGRIQGELDTPVNARGLLQAARNGGVLADLIEDATRFDFVSSPLLRARQTMEIIREKLGLPPQGYRTDDRLMEVSFGDWGGRTLAECEAAFPEEYALRQADVWNHRPPRGESLAGLMVRVRSWYEEHHGDAVIVAHGGVSRSLRGIVLNLQPADIYRLDAPQDKVLMVEDGRVTWL
jgi:broad specificity phosphatase PhoE